MNTSATYIPPPESTAACTSPAPITQPFGSLTDGSLGMYMSNLKCMWVITPTLDDVSSAVFRLRINITRFDTEPNFDFVSFYDGPSSLSPLIGRFSGTPLSSVTCQQSRCPSISSIVPTGLQLTIVFTSDDTVVYDGFALVWWMEAVYTQSGKAGLFPTSLPLVFASGGGIHSESSSVFINRCLFTNNSVTHPLLALGGAIFVSTSASKPFNLFNTTLEHNTVTANIAAGGAVCASLGVTVMANVYFQNNTAVGTGWCFVDTQDGVARCPASFGGAFVVANGASIEGDSCLFSLNTATCFNQYTTPCTASGAAMSVGGNIDVTTSVCTRNVVRCDATLGCSRGVGGCLHGFGTCSQ